MYRRTLWLAVLLVLVAATTTGCSAPSDVPGGPLGVESEAPPAAPPLPSSEQAIGVTDLGDGRVRAVGLLQYRASEGAIWVIVDAPVGVDPPADAPVLVVIENMSDLDSACSTNGALVYAEGTLADDAADTLPGPALTAEFVARAGE